MIYAWKNELEFIIDKFKDNMKYEQYKLLNSLCNILPTKTSNKVRINVNNTDNTILWPILTLRIILFYDYYNVFLINEKTIDFPSINIYAITSKYHINNYNMIFKHPPLDSCFFNNIRHKYTLIEY